MADAESEEVVASNEGVTVEKSFEPDDFPVPAIAFTVRSERDEAISVRLVDTVPDDVPTEDIGFHPKYGAEFWDVEDETIVFTREFEPNEEYVTVYGLRGKDAADVERFLTEPTLESVDPLDGDSGDVVRDVIDESDGEEPAPAGDGVESAVTEVGVDDAGEEDETDLDIDLPEPEEESDAETDDGAEAEASEGSAAAPAAAAPGVAEGSLAAALAEEVRAGDVDDEDLEELRDALGVTADDSTEARIEHLQSEVADLQAYTDALEEFLDEEGDAQTLIGDLREELQETTERFEEIESELEELWAAVDEGVDEELEAVREDIEAVEDEIEAETSERIEALEEDVEELEAELADVAEMRDRLATALGGIATGGGAETDDDGTDEEAADPEIELEDGDE
jgi:archaellum component FlaC